MFQTWVAAPRIAFELHVQQSQNANKSNPVFEKIERIRLYIRLKRHDIPSQQIANKSRHRTAIRNSLTGDG